MLASELKPGDIAYIGPYQMNRAGAEPVLVVQQVVILSNRIVPPSEWENQTPHRFIGIPFEKTMRVAEDGILVEPPEGTIVI